MINWYFWRSFIIFGNKTYIECVTIKDIQFFHRSSRFETLQEHKRWIKSWNIHFIYTTLSILLKIISNLSTQHDSSSIVSGKSGWNESQFWTQYLGSHRLKVYSRFWYTVFPQFSFAGWQKVVVSFTDPSQFDLKILDGGVLTIE